MYERFAYDNWYCWACGAEGPLDNAHIIGGQGRRHDPRVIARLCRPCHADHHATKLTFQNLAWLKDLFEPDVYDVDYMATLLIRRAIASQRHPLQKEYAERFMESRGMNYQAASLLLRTVRKESTHGH